MLSDWAPYGVLHASAGRAWERFDDAVPPDDPRGWQLSADPRGGTPGFANTAQPSDDRGTPNVHIEAASGPGASVAVVDLGATPCDGVLSVCALSGRRVAEISKFAQARGRIRVPLSWHEVHVAPGLYALVLDVRRAMNRGVERRAVSVTVAP